MLEAVINLAEGRRLEVLETLAQAVRPCLLDWHRDAAHHRSVFTLAGEAEELLDATVTLTAESLEHLRLSTHNGAHPRFGVVDVVPFVPLRPGRRAGEAVDFDQAEAAAAAYGERAAALGLAVYRYGPLGSGRTQLPDLRRAIRAGAPPALGPSPSEAFGAVCVGVRDVLVAWNLFVHGRSHAEVVHAASALRQPGLRTLALHLEPVGSEQPRASEQLSCNVVSPFTVPLHGVLDAARALLGGAEVEAELVGLVPEGAALLVPRNRWSDVDLDEERTIEARLRDPRWRR